MSRKRQVALKCQATNCDSRLRTTVKMFNFPSDSERKKLWIKVCERDADWFPTSRNQKLCQMHFNDDQFENRRIDGLRKLKWNAVPTIKTSSFEKSETTVKLEDPTYGIKTEPLYQGYEERLVASMEPDQLTNESKSYCQICDHLIDSYSNNLCKVCEKNFEIDEELNIQRKKKRMTIKYRCDECLKAFSNLNTYQRHVKCHDEKKPYRCEQCQLRFYHSKNLAEHMEVHETSFQSSSAATVTNIGDADDLTEESCVKIEFEKIDAECNSLANKNLNVQSTLNYGSKEMFRNPCNLTMVQIENFELFDQEDGDNETVDTGNDIFYEGSVSPTLSSATYNTEIKIEAETLQTTGGYEVSSVDTGQTSECEVKEEIVESATHQDRNEDVQRECYICKYCNKDFMYFGNYAKHLDQHLVGKLMCKFCHSVFGSTYQIRKHIRDYHSNQEMFDCSVCFTTLPKHYFASHHRTHRSEDKTLICKYCGCRFSEPSELFYHFKNRHSDSAESSGATHGKGLVETQPIQPIEDDSGTETYKCKYCGLMVDDVIKMYHHVKVHVNVKPTATAKQMLSTSGTSN